MMTMTRIFANSLKTSKNESSFVKSVFTLCKFRENDKCPPWSIQSSKMLHDNKKKTIYYNNAIIKVYDIPIFIFQDYHTLILLWKDDQVFFHHRLPTPKI